MNIVCNARVWRSKNVGLTVRGFSRAEGVLLPLNIILHYAKKKRLTEILQSRKKRAMMDPEGNVVRAAKLVVGDNFPGSACFCGTL